MPGRGTTLPGSWKPRSDEHRRTRRESSWRFRGPVTLPSQGRVHQDPPRSSPFSGSYKILTSHKLQQIGGGPPPICYNCEIKIYKYLDQALSKLPGREVLLFRAAEEPRSDEHRRTRKESSWRFRGPVTLPSRGRVHRSLNLQETLLSQYL